MTKKFRATVLRTEWASTDVIVEADDAEQALDAAYRRAYDTEFSRGNAEYEVEHLEEMEDDNNANL